MSKVKDLKLQKKNYSKAYNKPCKPCNKTCEPCLTQLNLQEITRTKMIIANAKSKDSIDVKFYGQIGKESWLFNGRAFDAWFSELDKKYKFINVKMHCYGGSVFEGNVIMNTIAATKAFVTIDVVGVAASMGGLVLQKAGKRRIARNGFVMVHSPVSEGRGNARQLKATAKLLEEIEENFTIDFSERSGKQKDEIAKLFDGNDHWYSAKEALEMKLVDEIFDPVADIKQLDKEQAAMLGQKGVYDRFAACFEFKEEPKIYDMDKTQLIAKAGLSGVDASSSDTAILDALGEKLESERKAKEKAEKDLLNYKTSGVKASIDAAVKDGRITEDERETYEAIGKNAGIDVLNKALGKLTPHETITSQLKGGKKPKGGERASWTWDDYQENDPDALERLEVEDKEAFNALYKAKYKVEPEN